MRCYSCGADKDLNVEVIYPYEEGHITQEVPVPQLLAIDCQAEKPLSNGSWDFRAAIMCHNCWHRLSVDRGIDMWIGQSCWESLNPRVPFADLPELLDRTKEDACNYPDIS